MISTERLTKLLGKKPMLMWVKTNHICCVPPTPKFFSYFMNSIEHSNICKKTGIIKQDDKKILVESQTIRIEPKSFP